MPSGASTTGSAKGRTGSTSSSALACNSAAISTIDGPVGLTPGAVRKPLDFTAYGATLTLEDEDGLTGAGGGGGIGCSGGGGGGGGIAGGRGGGGGMARGGPPTGGGGMGSSNGASCGCACCTALAPMGFTTGFLGIAFARRASGGGKAGCKGGDL